VLKKKVHQASKGNGHVRNSSHGAYQTLSQMEKKLSLSRRALKQNHITLIDHTITNNNDMVMYSETDDVDAYERLARSPATVQAMEDDGVERCIGWIKRLSLRTFRKRLGESRVSA
jgi:hypothetical protein